MTSNSRIFVLICLCLLALASTGCNFIYKQSVQQGNAFEEDQLDLLELGMTKRQVSLIMGTPAVQDPFHADRWDYVYTYAPRGKLSTQRHIVLQFEAGNLASIDGDIDQLIDPKDL